MSPLSVGISSTNRCWGGARATASAPLLSSRRPSSVSPTFAPLVSTPFTRSIYTVHKLFQGPCRLATADPKIILRSQPFLIFFLPSSALINRVGDNDNCTSIFSFLISDPPLNGTQLEHQHLVPKSTSECK